LVLATGTIRRLVVQVWYSLMTFGCIGLVQSHKPMKVAPIASCEARYGSAADMVDSYQFGAYTD